jgi:tripeptide aminopeptidase
MPDAPIDYDRLVSTFLELVKINSPSHREGAVAKHVIGILQELGAQVAVDDADVRLGGETGNIIARLPGTVEAPALLFNAHLDTVESTEKLRPRLHEDRITSDGDTILGADDKAGVAAILEMARAVRESGIPHPPLELVFTVAEEVGLMGSMVLDYELITARAGFVADSGGPVGRIVNRAPAQKNLKFTIHGRASHAGIAPEDGINAITVAAHAITGVRQGRIDAETTANIGIIRGGKATNIVPDTVEVVGEARSRDPQKLQNQADHMRAAFVQAAERHGATVDIEETDIYPAFNLEIDAPPLELAGRALQALELAPIIESTGGGSDANFFNAHGIQTVILSSGMSKPHCHDESLDLVQFHRLAQWLYHIVRVAGEV